MASIPGIGSGLDIDGLVNRLVAAERAPQSLRLNRIEAGANARLSALATVASALDRLRSASDPFADPSFFSARATVSSAPEVFSSHASSSAAVGRYDIEVLALASAQRLVSGALSESDGLGAGSLRITVGTDSFDVAIEAGADSPAAIVAAITSSAKAAGAGLGATLVRSDDGVHVVLRATDTGADQTIRVVRTAGASGLDVLVHDPGVLESLTEQSPASDARVRIDGLIRSAPSNRIDDAIEGLSLDLLTADPGTLHRLDVQADTSSGRKRIEAFVTAYNAVVNAIATATRFDAGSGQAAALTGDALTRNAALGLRSNLGAGFAAATAFGLDAGRLGLATRTDGTLTLDSAALAAALASDPDAVASAFAGSDGIATRIGSFVTGLVGDAGSITARQATLNSQIADVTEQRADLDRRLELTRERFLRQFTALDSLVAQLQSTSDFLARQLGGL